MEASRFGFGGDAAEPAFKFDPTDEEIVAFFLLPRAFGLPNPHSHAVLDADPASLTPWDLLRRHGHAGSHHAFFFGPPTDKAKNAGRRQRAVKAGGGGMWRGQKGVVKTITLLPEGGGGRELDVTFRKYDLTHKVGTEGGKKGRATGWVMHEFEIVSPEPPIPGIVLTRIKVRNAHELLRQQAAATAAADQEQHAEVPDVCGDGINGGNYTDRSYGAKEGGGDFYQQQDFQFPDQPEPNHQYNHGDADVACNDESFSGTQADALNCDDGNVMGGMDGYQADAPNDENGDGMGGTGGYLADAPNDGTGNGVQGMDGFDYTSFFAEPGCDNFYCNDFVTTTTNQG